MRRELFSQTYDLILESMKLQKVMLAFTETCIDNNSTNSGSLVFEKRMLKTKHTFLGMVFDLYECMWCSVAEAEKQFNTNRRKSFEQATFESKDLDMQNKINKVLHSMKKNIAELVADGIEYPMILTGICYMRQAYRRVILEDGFDGEKIAPEKRNQLLFLRVMDAYSRVASTNGMKVTKVTGKTHFESLQEGTIQSKQRDTKYGFEQLQP
jgi:hypothetical protein